MRSSAVSRFALSMLSLTSVLALAHCSDDGDPTPKAAPAASSSGGTAPPAASASPAPTGSSTPAPPPAATKDIVDTAIGAGGFKTLVAAVQAAGLEPTLRGAGPFTVFAPTDAAFAEIPTFLTDKLLSPHYKTELGLILKYHVLSGSVKAADVLGKSQAVDSVGGPKLHVNGASGKVIVNGSANVTFADVAASNGTIHVIDEVLLPTVIDTAASYVDGTTKFSTLVTAVGAADLTTTLAGPGPFTVFAPTDAAFDALRTALGDAAFNAILADKTKLSKILYYHVVPAAVYAKDVTPGDVTTVETGKLKISLSGAGIAIGDSTPQKANVILTDLPNRNGVIHAIDKVLLPAGL